MTKSEKVWATLGTVLLCASLMSCENSGPTATEASPSPSPEPTPVPTQLAVIVRVTAVQGGRKGITTVQHNSEFKLNGTATACFLLTVGAPPEATECPIIPRWSQRVIGGFGADCRPQGSLESDSVQWYCTQPGNPTFEACAQDFDGTELGCDLWALEVQ